MKTATRHNCIITLLTLFALGSTLANAAPLGTAFSYQGHLDDGSIPAQGIYDFRFAVYDAADSGAQSGNAITNSGVTVSKGLFTAVLNFGASVFTGNALWLDIGVRTNGGGSFTPLTPRQSLTATPYALYSPSAGSSASVPAGGITGTLPDVRLAGNVARTNQVWLLGGNKGTSPGANFVGTSDNQPVVFKANNTEAMRLLSNTNGPTLRLTGPGGVGAQVRLDLSTYAPESNPPFTNTPSAQIQASDDNYSSALDFLLKVPGNNANPLVSRLQLGVNGNVIVDPGDLNGGDMTPGLVFGAYSGEGIASKRSAGDNQYGLGFYTGNLPRMILANNGNLGIGANDPTAKLDVAGNTLVRGPAFTMPGDSAALFLGDTNHSIRSVYAGGLRLSTYQASDGITLSEGSGNVGIGTTNPAAKLEVKGGPIKATGGLIIETRTSDPTDAVPGRMWLRTDL
jgi:hypothetical protein